MKVSKLSAKFKVEDFWIGVYWEKSQTIDIGNSFESGNLYKTYSIYICILPCFPICIEISRAI